MERWLNDKAPVLIKFRLENGCLKILWKTDIQIADLLGKKNSSPRTFFRRRFIVARPRRSIPRGNCS